MQAEHEEGLTVLHEVAELRKSLVDHTPRARRDLGPEIEGRGRWERLQLLRCDLSCA